jgi:hypothetical protein
MKAYEDLARLRVDEAIRRGLKAQCHRQSSAMLQPVDLSALAESRTAAGSPSQRRVRRDFGTLLAVEWARATATAALWARALLRET